MFNFRITKSDQAVWDEELDGFLPQRIFDAHVHLLNDRHMADATKGSSWANTDLNALHAIMGRAIPGREFHFLVLGSPIPGINVTAHNQWLFEQVAQDPFSRLNRLVTPNCEIADLERDYAKFKYLGLKPYRLFSKTGDVNECRITDFLTHDQLDFANAHRLWITMHLSRFHGCADESNLADLHEFTTTRYPNVRWILAHCARSFTYWPIRQAIDRLREMPNIWYDLSAVTDVRPFITLFSKEDTQRIFYGSDAVDSTFFRGKYVTLGRAWKGLDESDSESDFPHCDHRPILCIYEQLLAMKHAAEIVQLSRDQIDDIFWNNAATAFELG